MKRTIPKSSSASDDFAKLQHELEVQQAELEIQNEELREANRQLQESNKNYKELYNDAALGYLTIDKYSQIDRANRTVCKILKQPVNSLLGRSFLMYIAHEDRIAYTSTLQRCSQSGEKASCDITFRPKEGPPCRVHLEVAAAQNDDGDSNGYHLALFEITHYWQIEQQRLSYIERLNALQRVSNEVLAETSFQPLLQRATDAALELTNASVGSAGFGYQNGQFKLEAKSGKNADMSDSSEQSCTNEMRGICDEIIEKGRSVLLTDDQLRRHPAWSDKPDGLTLPRGLLGAPLVGKDGRSEGVIIVTEKIEADFTAEDEALLVQLATITSIGLQNLQLRSEAERKAEEAEESERILDAIMEQAPEGIAIASSPGAVMQMISKYGLELLGRTEEEVIGTPVAQRADKFGISRPDESKIRPEDMPLWRATTLGEILQNNEIHMQRTDGKKLVFSCNSGPIRDENGKITGGILTWTDITKRKQTERQLQKARDELEMKVLERTAELAKSNEQLQKEIQNHLKTQENFKKTAGLLRRVLDTLPVGVFITDENGKIVMGNLASRQIWGGSRYVGVDRYDEYKGWWVENGELIQAEEWAAARAVKNGETTIDELIEIECFDGTHKIILNSAVPFSDEEGNIIGAIIVNQDVTERAGAEEALRQSEQRLRTLSTRLLKAHEDERKRVARDLHDSIGSSIAAIKFRLGVLNEQTEPNSQYLQNFADLISVVDHAVEEVRRIMSDLRPSMIDDLGLLPTVGWFCKRIQSLYDPIVIRRKISITEEDVPDHLKIVFFRIIQEALNNAVKYSKTNQIDLSLKPTKDSIELRISDKGAGFDVGAVLSDPESGKGFGISGMRERVELSGGHFSIESARGKGTNICAVWPIPPKQNSE
ncbi:MAG: PAS domain S-box protein [Desulfoferrobacter sp.]